MCVHVCGTNFAVCVCVCVCVLSTTGLAKEFLSDYCQVNIGSTDLVANHNITQIVEVCLSETKSSM